MNENNKKKAFRQKTSIFYLKKISKMLPHNKQQPALHKNKTTKTNNTNNKQVTLVKVILESIFTRLEISKQLHYIKVNLWFCLYKKLPFRFLFCTHLSTTLPGQRGSSLSKVSLLPLFKGRQMEQEMKNTDKIAVSAKMYHCFSNLTASKLEGHTV